MERNIDKTGWKVGQLFTFSNRCFLRANQTSFFFLSVDKPIIVFLGD